MLLQTAIPQSLTVRYANSLSTIPNLCHIIIAHHCRCHRHRHQHQHCQQNPSLNIIILVAQGVRRICSCMYLILSVILEYLATKCTVIRYSFVFCLFSFFVCDICVSILLRFQLFWHYYIAVKCNLFIYATHNHSAQHY